ncbi:MAG: hypothetical protein WC764_00790 [Candidatus Paceibacterota bacterium]|jgi:hypothetical protein
MNAAVALIGKIESAILNPIIGLLGAAALAYFIWGVAEFIYHVDNEAERSKGRQHMLYGVIGLAIMISVFGILNVVCNTVGAGGCK